MANLPFPGFPNFRRRICSLSPDRLSTRLKRRICFIIRSRETILFSPYIRIKKVAISFADTPTAFDLPSEAPARTTPVRSLDLLFLRWCTVNLYISAPSDVAAPSLCYKVYNMPWNMSSIFLISALFPSRSAPLFPNMSFLTPSWLEFRLPASANVYFPVRQF